MILPTASITASAQPDPTTATLWVAVVIFVVGVLGIVIPVLPGLLLCVLAVLLWAVDTGGTIAWATFGGALLVYLIGVMLQLLLPGRRMRSRGVSTGTIVAGLVAGVVGLFVVPVVGGPLFFVGAVYLLERLRHREHARAWAATRAAVRGVMHSMGIELLAATTIALVWTAGVLAHRL